ncbi:MAG: RnfABCDGE type electron transport complex subunit G [Mariprofundales bacterium]|nr:RnfABCDGE type electron transport complex subunit G [Mariprofundales bacterium]
MDGLFAMGSEMSREQWTMVATLVVVVSLGAVLLALAHYGSKGPIAQAREAALHRMLVQVLPPHDNAPARATVEEGGHRIYIARSHGEVVGFSWSVVAPDGYQGAINILLGVDVDGTIHAIRVITHSETPGLGDGIVNNQPWIDQFIGQTLGSINWAVRKDGGDFDQFTGATITPRAVVSAVHRGVEWFVQHRRSIVHLAETAQ